MVIESVPINNTHSWAERALCGFVTSLTKIFLPPLVASTGTTLRDMREVRERDGRDVERS